MDENLETFLMRYLGKEYFDACKELYDKVKENKIAYKIIVSERCADLMYLFSVVEGDNFGDIFYTTDSILSNVKQLVDKYQNLGFFPRIILVDDIPDHGENLEKFLKDLTDKVCQILKENGIKYTWRNIVDGLNAAVTINVVTIRYDQLLVKSSIWINIKPVKKYKKEDITDLSFRISQVVSFCALPDKNSTPYFKVNYSDTETLDRICRWLDSNMIASPINGTCLTDIWISPVETASGNAKAVLIIQSRTHRFDGSKSFIPSIIAPDVSRLNVALESVKDNDFHQVFENIRDHIPDAGTAVLCVNLLLQICNDCNAGPVLYNGALYRGCEDSFGLSVRKTPWFELNESKKLILNAVKDSQTLFQYSSAGTVSNNVIPVKEALADVICDVAYEEAKYIRMQLKRQYYRTKRFIDLHDAIVETSNRLNGFSTDGYSFMVSFISALILLQNMSVIDFDDCTCRPGKRALYYMPDRYYTYFGIIEVGERHYQFDVFSVKAFTRRWFTKRIGKEETDKIVSVIQQIYDAGFTVHDWTLFSLSNWIKDEEISGEGFVSPEEIRKQYINKSVRKSCDEGTLKYEYLKSLR